MVLFLISQGNFCKSVIVKVGIKCILSKSFKLNNQLLNSESKQKLYPKPQVPGPPLQVQEAFSSRHSGSGGFCGAPRAVLTHFPPARALDGAARRGAVLPHTPRPPPAPSSEVEGGVASFSKAFSYPRQFKWCISGGPEAS